MYLADATLNHRIRKIDLDTGIVTTIAGSSSVGGFGGDGGPPTSALLNQPLSVAFDADGDMYVADFTNFRLRKVAPEDPGESTTEIDACGPSGLEFLPFSPTLTFPLNFAVLQGEATITWKPADPPDPCGDDVTYELQFTRTVSRNSGWKTISSAIPATETQLVFDVSEIPYTQDGGLRIRAKDNKSLFSEFSSSNEPFTIANHAPAPVTLFSPLANDVFDNCMAVVWREAAIKDVDGHSISYQVEMTDRFSKNDGWLIIPGAEALPDGTTTFEINMFDFADGDDYGIRVSAVDELGLSSTPKSIGPIRIKHQGNFIIDTIPPEGSISINDGAALASNTRVKLTLFASDATTGVKDVRFRNAEEDCFGDFDTFVSEKFWDLPKSDGVKRVFVQYRDCADNVSEVCDCEIVSRVLCDAGNAMDIEVFNDKLYVAFDANGNLVEYKVLVKRAAELAEPELTALAKFKNFLYIATYDPASGAAIYAFDGRATLSFSLAGVKVLTMQAYNEKLFLGLDDGKIKSFDEMSVATVFAGLKAVTRLRTDGAVLYASLRGAGEYLTTVDGIFWKVNPL
jgi:hypothetical protein